MYNSAAGRGCLQKPINEYQRQVNPRFEVHRMRFVSSLYPAKIAGVTEMAPQSVLEASFLSRAEVCEGLSQTV